MTIVLGLRCPGGAVMAADSQITQGGVRTSGAKLFSMPRGIIWGTAGHIAAAQALYTELEQVDNLPPQPGREEAKRAIQEATQRAAKRVGGEAGEEPPSYRVDGLFAWYSADDNRSYLLRARGDGGAEFAPQYMAVGNVRYLTEYALFAFSRSEYLDYATLPLETAKMLAFMAADDVIRAASSGVDHPVQLAVVTADSARVLRPEEGRPVEDTAAAFRETQREFLARTSDEPDSTQGRGGLRPEAD